MSTLYVRRILLFTIIVLLLSNCKEDSENQKQEGLQHPNIIFLLTDDQRWDALGYAGNQTLQTPNIDALAKNGVYFKNAYVTTSICAVSRASILTGQYARRHQIWGFSKDFSEKQLNNTYPLLLRKSGYRTGFIGKYGVGHQLPKAKFDYWKGFPGQGTFTQKDSAGNAIYLTQKIGQQASEFLELQKSSDKPFCLSVSFKAPHVEGDPGYFLPNKIFDSLYRNTNVKVPKTSNSAYFDHFPKEFTENNVARNRWKDRFATPVMQQESIKKYYRLIHGVDVVVGDIVEKLKDTGQDKNTVIIFTSDNGFYLGEYGFAGKWYGSNPSIRIPMIIYDPRKKHKGIVIEKIALNIDLAPTILSIANVDIPKIIQGKDLTKLIDNPKTDWRDAFFYEHLWQSSNRYYIPSTEGVVCNDKKYMKYFRNENTEEVIFEELYDISEDPDEIKNLINVKGQETLKFQMKEQYEILKKEAH
ncbi:sulfatase [Aquimarina celericrescens]|uniref:Sulfatase n=1 Tax=Aquimarina celericrescens TaxID=1964542 RepID=A0ABW5B117_9FLAO|nr:sulfatase [Aquimarina celericrescens]